MRGADPTGIAAQANEIAEGWSTAGAPASWRLTAETFRAIAGEPALLELAAAIPPERLPPLLLSAAVQYLVAERRPARLAAYYPRRAASSHPSTTASDPPSSSSAWRSARRSASCVPGTATR